MSTTLTSPLSKKKGNIRVRILHNYPRTKKRNKRNEWVETGSLHLYVKLESWEFDLRGIFYVLCKGKVWIKMPTKKGVLNGKDCEFPITDIRDKEQKAGIMRLLQGCFLGFMKSTDYVSFDEWEKRQRIGKAKINMVFRDIPRKTRL